MSEQPPQQGWGPRDETAARSGPGVPDGTGRPSPPGGKPGGRQGRRRTGWRRAVPTRRMLLAGFLIVAALLIGAFAAGYLLVHIPPANATAVAQSNVYLYEDGSRLALDGEVNRENVPLAQIPLTVQRAVLAAEDRDFYSERAVDPKAMVRAAWNTLTGKGKQSGSTITQQYVKNYYLGQEQTLSRKWKEFFIAIKLGREQSKGQILQGYLNTSYFGRNAYGAQAAAQAYYGTDVSKLTTAQGAYLASLLNAPSAFDVSTHPENRPAALARWHYTLDGMVKTGWLSPAERAAMSFPDPQSARPATGLSGQRGYVVQAVEEYLTSEGIVDEKTLAAGGYRITTTLERDRQDAFVKAVDDQVTDRLDPGRRAADRNVRVGGAAIDPESGRVVALYGGVDYTRQYVNNATRRDYQVGSTFKPFVLTAAVEEGSRTQDGRRITPNTVYDGNDRRPVQGWSGARYAPENEDGASYGPITVRTATDRSVNAVYAQMAVDVGPARVKRTAIALGLPENTPDLSASPSIALGPATASVLDMAEAYATLANHGRHGRYTLVSSVSKDGAAVGLPARDERQAVSREAADTTTSVLQSVVDSGTGTAAQSAGRPAAGKTGTAEEDKAAWFAGYTPQLATVVAVMGQDPETGVQKPLYGAMGLPRVNGGGAPARIWGQFTGDALEGTEIMDFELVTAPGAYQERSDAPPSPPGADSGTPSGAVPPRGASSAPPGGVVQPPPVTGPSQPADTGPPVLPPPGEPGPPVGAGPGTLPGPPDGGYRDQPPGAGAGTTNGGTGLVPSAGGPRRPY
ncbi:transglycosylase domain-containing protein [Streptomyces qinzhouensis]|uniref:transglycosylase domain-containing protein n=1 Tax=Streptomyces qinzhouensis TaxID=2599401 RepID=UPI001FE393CB|nr:transglycosylase domain-containing protein [Streptomyces qinzhouensis]